MKTQWKIWKRLRRTPWTVRVEVTEDRLHETEIIRLLQEIPNKWQAKAVRVEAKDN